MVDGHINRECVSHDYSSYDSPNAKSRDVLPHCHSPVSKSDNLLTGILDKRWESLHAILLRAAWQWSCVRHVSRPDSMSRSWTACLQVRHSISLIVLTKYERACMQSCNKRLGSDLVWGMSQDQTVCLEVGQPVCKLDILSHWLSWQNMRELACNLVMGFLAVNLCEVWLNIRQYVSKLNNMTQSQTFWLTDCLDKTWESLQAILLRASWQWSCVKYVSRSDSMSWSWTACLKVGRSAH